jgi:hypothetical protein
VDKQELVDWRHQVMDNVPKMRAFPLHRQFRAVAVVAVQD